MKKQYDISYKENDTFEEKINRLEKLPTKTYFEILGIDENFKELADMFPLYHGLRFDSINKLESIFKNRCLLCGKKIESSFISYNGTTKYLYINSYSDENCNQGEYISVMPYQDYSIEFNTFVRENLFIVLNGNIPAKNTFYLNYNDYSKLKKLNIKTNNLYSYAFAEYMVKDSISIDDFKYIGIDYRYFKGDLDKTIDDVIKLINFYKIDVPFVDISNYHTLYDLNDKQKVRKLIK